MRKACGALKHAIRVSVSFQGALLARNNGASLVFACCRVEEMTEGSRGKSQ
jgi:hypothetical protein